MQLHDIIPSYVVFVLVAGTAGYALARMLDAAFRLSARTRQLLYAAAITLPLTAFVMDIVHWTEVCISYAAHIIDALKLSQLAHGDGFAVLTVLVALGHAAYLISGKRVSRGSLQLSANANYHERVSQLLKELGAGEHVVQIYRTPYPIACVAGLRTPVIRLSHGVLDVMDDRELKAVLAHELAHIAGRDNMLNLAVQVVKHLTFFSPAAHLAAAKYAVAREEAADDMAAEMVGESADLASALVKVIRRATGCARILQPVFGYSSFLESDLALYRAERIMSEPHKQPRNILLEQGLLLTVTTVVPMLFC